MVVNIVDEAVATAALLLAIADDVVVVEAAVVMVDGTVTDVTVVDSVVLLPNLPVGAAVVVMLWSTQVEHDEQNHCSHAGCQPPAKLEQTISQH